MEMAIIATHYLDFPIHLLKPVQRELKIQDGNSKTKASYQSPEILSVDPKGIELEEVVVFHLTFRNSRNGVDSRLGGTVDRECAPWFAHRLGMNEEVGIKVRR